jgi:hypothetical protein
VLLAHMLLSHVVILHAVGIRDCLNFREERRGASLHPWGHGGAWRFFWISSKAFPDCHFLMARTQTCPLPGCLLAPRPAGTSDYHVNCSSYIRVPILLDIPTQEGIGVLCLCQGLRRGRAVGIHLPSFRS